MNADQEYEIDLLELCRVLWKNALAIALVAVIFGAAVFGVTVFFITPTYEATASMYINNNNSLDFGSTSFEISAGELTTSNSLVPAYLYVLRSRTTMEDIIAEANLSYTTEELEKMITATAVDKVAAFEVTVTSESPSEAEMIANTIAKLLPDRFAEVMDGSAVRIVDYAIIPSHRASPSILVNTVLGCMIGAVLSAAIVILRNLLDDRSRVMIQSADEIRAMYPDLRILAVIPDMRTSEKKNGYYSSYYGPTDSKKKGGKKHG